MNIYELLKWFAQPVVRLALSFLFPVGVLLGTLVNPSGAVNTFLCARIDQIASVWPSTPEHLKLASLVQSSAGSLGVGAYVVGELFTMAFSMLAIILLIKLYKLIPFKAT